MPTDAILETRGLVKEFKGFVAVDGVDLKVRRGDIHALIGPNGAGKTTCFNLLTKFLVPTRGQILFEGQDITKEQPAQINVNVDASGRYQINDGGVADNGVDAIASALTHAAGAQKDPVVVISADDRATHQSVIRVMDAARRVGFNRVTFVTQSAVTESP